MATSTATYACSTTSQTGLALNLVMQNEPRLLQDEMDGTRVSRVAELYREENVGGKAFQPNVRCFPSTNELDRTVSWQQIQNHVLNVREKKAYAAEVYSFNPSDITDKPPIF